MLAKKDYFSVPLPFTSLTLKVAFKPKLAFFPYQFRCCMKLFLIKQAITNPIIVLLRSVERDFSALNPVDRGSWRATVHKYRDK